MFNRRNSIALAGMLLFIPFASTAQSYVDDALTFSRTKPGGSARIQAIGGAQIALGGDYSSALSNPAGLGMFNRSEFTFTPGLSSYSTTSQYFGNSDKDGKTVFNIPGISLVIHSAKNKGGLVSGAFGISMTRVNDFQGAATFYGTDSTSSIIDSFIGIANGLTTEQFDESADPSISQYNTPTGLAYYNYLIGAKSILDPPGPDNEYFTDAPIISNQHVSMETKGATNQWSISYGGNYKDIFFFGGGIGITSLKHKSQRIYDETFNSDTIRSLSLTENIQTKGSGINATIGFIVRPVNFLQIGASFTSPTVYNISSSYDAAMSSNWNNFDYFGMGIQNDFLNEQAASTDIVVSEYSLTTPLKFSAGIALISKFGFISGDIELTNPAQTKYSDNSNTSGQLYSQENADIKSTYKSTLNYRIGAEYRYEIYRFRGGFGFQANPYQSYLGIDNSITTISGGVGMRKTKYYVDLALVNSTGKPVYYQPYSLPDGYGPIAKMKSSTFTAMITVGLTF